ncbi:MAG: patatin-like phospholipase family protein [Bacteroidales bacterium]
MSFHSKWKYFLILVYCLLTFQVNLKTQINNTNRPKVGLVLSGGGAKGLAHIGVLKVLEKNNIPVDYITGTSMGSIIGSLYAIGYSATEIEKIALSMDWDEIFDGSTPRNLISIEEKDLEGKYFLEVPMKKGKPVIPTGLILGQRLEMEISKITWSVHNVNDFSKFQIPFACIATNIETGEAVVLNKGYLPDAIRASMAIPSVFSAVEIDGKLLVDGGLVRNFPVSDIKNMGADIVIGVDVASPLYKKDQLTSMLKIMEQAASFLNEQTNVKETKLVDILIKPDITGFDASSFYAADTLIENGEKAALLVENQLKELKTRLNIGQDSVKTKSPPSLYSIYIKKILFEGLNKVSKSLVKSKLNIKDSSWVTLNDIEEAVSRLFGSRYFEKVNYRIVQYENGTDLVIRVTEQPFSIYKVGIQFNNYLNASIGINGTFRNILGEGSRLLLDAKLGLSPEFSIDYSIFTRFKPSVGFIFHSEYYNIEETLYNINDSLNTDINNNSFLTRSGFASSLGNSTLFILGAEISYKKFDPKNFTIEGKVPSKTGIMLYTELKHDTYDRNIYPESGSCLNLYVGYMLNQYSESTFDYDKKFWKFRINYDQYFKLSEKLTYRHTFTGAFTAADSLFYNDRFFMGGELNFKNYIFPLSGYRFMQISAQNILTGNLELRIEPWQNKFIFFNTNAGISEKSFDDIFKPSQIYFGTSLGIGIKTFFGPIEYKISTNNFDNAVNHWIKIGYYF